MQTKTTTQVYRCVGRVIPATIGAEAQKGGKVTGVRIVKEAKDNYLVTVERTESVTLLESVMRRLTKR